MNNHSIPQQLDFADAGGDAVFRKPRRPSRGKTIWPLKESARSETMEFKQTLIRQGRVGAASANTYRKALNTAAKQAQRYLGRYIDSVWEIFTPEIIAAIARDDRPFDELVGDQLADFTMRQRRVVLRAFITAMAPLDSRDELEGVVDDVED